MTTQQNGKATACGHDASPFGSPLCVHLRDCTRPWLAYVKWYTGKDLDVDLLCRSCADSRRDGMSVAARQVCEACFRNATEEVGDLVGSHGQPQIHNRAEPFETQLTDTVLPAAIGAVADLAAVDASAGSRWLLLTEDGSLISLDTSTLDWTRHGRTTVPAEPEREKWNNHAMRRRLHVSAQGEFAAVVNDFGRWGEIIHLRSGRPTLQLDGGDYHPETVPFSFAFAEIDGRTLAIHRTDWNRLDISDPVNGELLTDRGPTRYSSDKRRPQHYLDYFHGALLVSPGSTRILDDGWVWHPVGVPSTWCLEQWLHNRWESEDGPSKLEICARDGYWNGPFTWLDDARVVVGGIGDDDTEMVQGARVFDVSVRGTAGPRWRSDWKWALETKAFAGPAGTFFSDGKWLFSSDEIGLSRWDPASGARTGHVPGFFPSRYHRGARELLELRDGLIVRMSV